MTEREYSGSVKPGQFKHAKSGAYNPEILEEIANEVREFDKNQSTDHRQAKALEKIAELLGARGESSTTIQRREQMREREVQALELQAVVPLLVAIGDEAAHDALRDMRIAARVQTLITRLGGHYLP